MIKKSENAEFFIVKSNNLIEARYRLSLQESQVVLWLLTQIRSNCEDFKQYKLDTTEFVKFTGVRIDSRYSELRKVTRQLMQRVMEIYCAKEDKTIQVSWLSSAEYEHKKGYVLLEFSPKLKPYLLQLKSQFTKIGITDTLKLKSIYAIRIFELLLQYLSISYRKMTVDELRAYCGIEKIEYRNYFDLKRYVIERARSEITSKTEYQVDYAEIKESRKVVAIEWRINKKNQEKEKQQQKIKTLENELTYKFALISELMDYGYSKSLATKLVKENDEVVIKNALQAVSMQLSKKQVKNPGAMLRVAIKEKWAKEHYVPRRQSKAQNNECFLDQNAHKSVADSDSNNSSAIEQFDILTDLSKILKKF